MILLLRLLQKTANYNMDNLNRLLNGNKLFLKSKDTIGDISLKKRKDVSVNGQHPFVTIITCSDSRVVPEAIFHAGLGELFVIRTAGNTIGEGEIGSIEYGVEHLGTELVVVLGHTQCGAIHSAVHAHKGNFVNVILNKISLAIKDEKDETKATILNIRNSVNEIKTKLNPKAEVIGMLYHLDSGEIELIK